MKIHLIFIFSLLLSFTVFSQEIKESDLPATVKSTFKEQFKPKGKVTWTKSGKQFVATFKSDDQTHKATFSDEGKWISTRDEINFKELPGSISTYISENFKDAVVMESATRETETENKHYYILLNKNGTTLKAELFFDLKGELISENVPESFAAAKEQTTTKASAAVDAPQEVVNAFAEKFPSAKVTAWTKNDTMYIAEYTSEGVLCKAGFSKEGEWKTTRYTIPEKELSSPIVADVKQYYKGFKITISEMVQEPAVTDYYYVFAKKEGIDQPSVELYYSMTGTRTKKKEYTPKTSAEKEDDATTDDDGSVSNLVEKISPKELPSSVIPYVKEHYPGYAIKETVLSTTDKGTFYYLKIKKEGLKEVIELSFDVKGKCVTPQEKKEE